MSNKALPIGIFDSGIGGLTVVRAVHRALPGEDIVYLGDTARVPYGVKTQLTVSRYALQVAHALMRQDVKMLVVACNTASAMAMDALHATFGDEGIGSLGMIQGRKARGPARPRRSVPIVGVIEPGAEAAVDRTRSGRIAVTGTEGTIRNGAYERAIRELRPDAVVTGVACPLFVSLAEEGWVRGQVVDLVAEEYLAHLRGLDVDTLILGCTHYPLLRDVIQQTVGPGIALVDSAPTTARVVAEALRATKLANDPGHRGTIRFLATDNPERFRSVGSRFLEREIDDVEVVDL